MSEHEHKSGLQFLSAGSVESMYVGSTYELKLGSVNEIMVGSEAKINVAVSNEFSLAAEMAWRLRKQGVQLPENILTNEDLVMALCR